MIITVPVTGRMVCEDYYLRSFGWVAGCSCPDFVPDCCRSVGVGRIAREKCPKSVARGAKRRLVRRKTPLDCCQILRRGKWEWIGENTLERSGVEWISLGTERHHLIIIDSAIVIVVQCIVIDIYYIMRITGTGAGAGAGTATTAAIANPTTRATSPLHSAQLSALDWQERRRGRQNDRTWPVFVRI